LKLVGISGSLVGWKTTQAVHDVLFAAKGMNSSIQTELVDLRDYEVEFVRGTPLTYYNEDTIHVVKTILSADALVIGTPIYQASITGVLKNLLDHLPTDALKSKVIGIITTGGTDKHFLVAEYQLKPILSFLKGTVSVSNVFVHNDSFNEENEIVDVDIARRINKLAEEILFLQERISK